MLSRVAPMVHLEFMPSCVAKVGQVGKKRIARLMRRQGLSASAAAVASSPRGEIATRARRLT